MEFKQWLLEYEADIDYDAQNQYANLLPTRRTIVHDIAADLRDDFGKVFSKRMGSGMPQGGGYYYSTKDPISMFNDNQYIYVTVEEPLISFDGNIKKEELSRYLQNAYDKIKSDHEISKKLLNARVSFTRDELSKRTKTVIFNKNGQDYARFTFRFKANVTPGPGYDHNYNNYVNDNDMNRNNHINKGH